MNTARKQKPHYHPLARAKLTVTFVRTDRKFESEGQYGDVRKGSGRIHDVYVEDVKIGELCKDYSEGYVAARGCVGGSAPGEWRWYLNLMDSLRDRVDGPFFMHTMSWHLLKDAKERIVNEMNKPLSDYDFEDGHDWCFARVNVFCEWLAEQKGKTNVGASRGPAKDHGACNGCNKVNEDGTITGITAGQMNLRMCDACMERAGLELRR